MGSEMCIRDRDWVIWDIGFGIWVIWDIGLGLGYLGYRLGLGYLGYRLGFGLFGI